jgi:hypothetical protein
VNAFIFGNILESGSLVFFLGVYLGAVARNKYHGMQRIQYEDFDDWDGKPLQLFLHVRLKMWFARFVIFNALFFCPLFALPPRFWRVYAPDKAKYGAATILLAPASCAVTIFMNYVAFSYFELICLWFGRDFNHFELVSQDHTSQKVSNLYFKD